MRTVSPFLCAPLASNKKLLAPSGGQESSVRLRTVQANSIALILFRPYSTILEAPVFDRVPFSSLGLVSFCEARCLLTPGLPAAIEDVCLVHI